MPSDYAVVNWTKCLDLFSSDYYRRNVMARIQCTFCTMRTSAIVSLLFFPVHDTHISYGLSVL